MLLRLDDLFKITLQWQTLNVWHPKACALLAMLSHLQGTAMQGRLGLNLTAEPPET